MTATTQVAQSLPPTMLLFDGTQVVDNMKVYNLYTRYDTKTSKHLRIIGESTVIWANNTARYFIVRCSAGCETKVKMANGCSSGEGVYYGDLANAQKEWNEQLRKAIDYANESGNRYLKEAADLSVTTPVFEK